MRAQRDPDGCRKRLIEAAGQVFGEVGFRRATIREIARRAGLGLGIVNYHFRDKEGLYGAVCAQAFENSMSEYERELAGAPDAEEKLRRYVRVFIAQMLTEESADWHGRILMHAMSEPHTELAEFVRKRIRPHHALLSGIVAELLDAKPDSAEVFEHCLVVAGQCLIHNDLRDVTALLRGRAYGRRDVDRLAERVARIALAGIADEKRRRTARRKDRTGLRARATSQPR